MKDWCKYIFMKRMNYVRVTRFNSPWLFKSRNVTPNVTKSFLPWGDWISYISTGKFENYFKHLCIISPLT